MNIYVAHSGKIDFENELYKPLEESEIGQKHSLFLPERETNKKINTKDIIKKDIDLLIAEISFPATGLGIELGRAETYNVPIVGIYRTGHTFANSIRFVTNTFIEYDGTKDLVDKLIQHIKKIENGLQQSAR